MVVTTCGGSGPQMLFAFVAAVNPPNPVASSAVDTAVVPNPTCRARISYSNRHAMFVCDVELFGYACEVSSTVLVPATAPVAVPCCAVVSPNSNVAVVDAVATQDTIPFAMTLTTWLARPCWKNPPGSCACTTSLPPDAPVAPTTRFCRVVAAAATCAQPAVAPPAAW